MALPSSGEISVYDIYEEYYKSGPGSGSVDLYTLESLYGVGFSGGMEAFKGYSVVVYNEVSYDDPHGTNHTSGGSFSGSETYTWNSYLYPEFVGYNGQTINMTMVSSIFNVYYDEGGSPGFCSTTIDYSYNNGSSWTPACSASLSASGYFNDSDSRTITVGPSTYNQLQFRIRINNSGSTIDSYVNSMGSGNYQITLTPLSISGFSVLRTSRNRWSHGTFNYDNTTGWSGAWNLTSV